MKTQPIPSNPLIKGADRLSQAADVLTQLANDGHHEWNGYGTVRELRTALDHATKAVEKLERLAEKQREKNKSGSSRLKKQA